MGTESTVLGDDGTPWEMIFNGHCQRKLQRQSIFPRRIGVTVVASVGVKPRVSEAM